jgi:hypothetical protein
MSRTVIAAVVAAVIAALTGIAYFVAATSFDDRQRKDADAQLARAYQVVQQLNQLEGIDISNKAERLAAEREFAAALKTDSNAERQGQAGLGFQKFVADDKQPIKPDIIALCDASGNVVAMNEQSTVVARLWKNDKGEIAIPALNVALERKVIISDLWWDEHNQRLMRIGVAPVIETAAPVSTQDPDGVVIIGAIVVAYAETTRQAQHDRALLGTEIAYYDNRKVIATSFTAGTAGASPASASNEEDTARARALSELLRSGALVEGGGKQHPPVQRLALAGVDYLAASVKMPRSATRKLPPECTASASGPCYPPMTAGAVVLAPIADAAGTAITVKLFLLLLGGGALAIALLGMYLAHRRLIAQVDQIELGVTDIINGNVDRTFRPVGLELDGLANGLNVMLARLLGRPEPGEEEFDDDGNPILQGRVEFEDSDTGAPDPGVATDLAALAQESEPDYYKRVYTEYLAARRDTGSPDEVSFETFIAKLKVNEGKLRAQHHCRAVRFRVVIGDGRVTLKPVPIFG